MIHLKSHFFFYTMVLLIGLMVATSYYRFMVTQDYIVGYEGDCDPYTQDCYVYCEEWDDDDVNNDDECAEPFYYSWIERHAGMIYETCGHGLVTECDDAYECSNGDESCAIYFCDIETEDCEDLTEADMPEEEGGEIQLEFSSEEFLLELPETDV